MSVPTKMAFELCQEGPVVAHLTLTYGDFQISGLTVSRSLGGTQHHATLPDGVTVPDDGRRAALAEYIIRAYHAKVRESREAVPMA